MERQYYVQVIAENYLKNVIDNPETMKIHSKFLQGLTQEQFKEGFLDLLSIIRSLYYDIACDPQSFGMMLKENIDSNAKGSEYTNSNASFLRVPNLLLILGTRAELQPDMALTIDGVILTAAAKELKITSVSFLLSKLREYGFEITGLEKTIKSGDIISVSYTDNRTLTVALKAMADALLEINKGDLKKYRNYFYMMHNGLLENEKAKEPKVTIESIYHALDSSKRECAATLHKNVAAVTKHTIRMGGFMRNDWSCVYTNKKNKRVLMSLQVDQKKLSAKLNLQHINQYMPLVTEQPEKIQESIRLSGWECGHCHSSCSGGFAFEMDGQSYNKCRCGSFVFDDITIDDVKSCEKLLNQELSVEN